MAVAVAAMAIEVAAKAIAATVASTTMKLLKKFKKMECNKITKQNNITKITW